MPDLEAILVEPAACASHGIERMAPKPGSTVLLFGCGPTGMLLAQLLRANGAAHVCEPIAASMFEFWHLKLTTGFTYS